MRLICNARDLAQQVALVERAISRRATWDSLKKIRLTAQGDHLELTGTDLELFARTSLEANVTEIGDILLDAKTMGQIAPKLPAEEVEITNDQFGAVITSGPSRFKLTAIDPADSPEFPSVDGQAVTVAGATFRHAVKQVVLAAADIDYRPMLTGVYLEASGDGLNLVATDSSRLALKQLDGQYGERSAIIPASALRFAATIEAEEVQITVGEKQAQFTMGDTVVVSRLIEGQYPNYRQVIPDLQIQAVIDRKQLLGALDRLSIASNIALFELSQAGLTLRSKDNERGEAEETLDVEYGGDDLRTAYQIKYLMEPLKALVGDQVVWRPQDELGPAIFQEPGDDSYIYLVMPVKVN